MREGRKTSGEAERPQILLRLSADAAVLSQEPSPVSRVRMLSFCRTSPPLIRIQADK